MKKKNIPRITAVNLFRFPRAAPAFSPPQRFNIHGARHFSNKIVVDIFYAVEVAAAPNYRDSQS